MCWNSCARNKDHDRFGSWLGQWLLFEFICSDHTMLYGAGSCGWCLVVNVSVETWSVMINNNLLGCQGIMLPQIMEDPDV